MIDAERSVFLRFRKAPLFHCISLQDAIPDNTATELGNKFCFVQNYQIVGKGELSIDGVEEYLNCIRLRWGLNSRRTRETLSNKEYGLIPCDSIRRQFQFVLAKVDTILMDSTVP